MSTEKLEQKLQEALTDVMCDRRFMALTEAQALRTALDLADTWRARLGELEDEEDDA